MMKEEMKAIFKKSNLVCFWVLIFFAFIALLFSFKFNDPYAFDSEFILSPYKDISINFLSNSDIPKNEIYVCFDEYCLPADTKIPNNIVSGNRFDFYNKRFREKSIRKIKISYPAQYPNYENTIDEINVNVGFENKYYSNREIKNFPIQKQGKFNDIILPDIDNDKGFINNICCFILSLFYNLKAYILFYLFLFSAFGVYLFNKQKPEFQFIKSVFENKKTLYFYLGFLIFIAGMLRLNDITYTPLWLDELYTKLIATKDFLSTYKDSGNPPLFFVIEYFMKNIFSDSTFVLRLPSCIFGILFVPCSYLVFKNISKKPGLIAAFLASLNILNIYQSQEARSYSLCMLLTVFVVYYIFEYLKRPTLKNLILLSLFSVFSINTHYFLAFFIFCNFFYVSFVLLKNNRHNDFLKFFLSQIVVALSFLPYLFISLENAMGKSFNSLFGTLNSEALNDTMIVFFGNGVWFSVFLILIIFNIIFCFIKKFEKNSELKNLLFYLLYSIIAVFILIYLVAEYIKPIYIFRVAISLYSLLFLLEVVVAVSVLKFKNPTPLKTLLKTIYSIFVIILIFSTVRPVSPLKWRNNLHQFIDFIQHDAEKYKNKYEINVLIPDYIEYLEEYKNIKNLDYINWHVIKINEREYIPIEYFTENKNTVTYPFFLIYMTYNFEPLNDGQEFYFYQKNMFDNIKIITK